MSEVTFKETANTGGSIMIDLFEFADGRILGIGEECAVLYPSIDAFYGTAEDIDYAELPMIEFDPKRAALFPMEHGNYNGLGSTVVSLVHEHVVDLITIDTGEVLGVNSDYVGLYPNAGEFWSPFTRGASQRIDLAVDA